MVPHCKQGGRKGGYSAYGRGRRNQSPNLSFVDVNPVLHTDQVQGEEEDIGGDETGKNSMNTPAVARGTKTNNSGSIDKLSMSNKYSGNLKDLVRLVRKEVNAENNGVEDWGRKESHDSVMGENVEEGIQGWKANNIREEIRGIHYMAPTKARNDFGNKSVDHFPS